MHRQLAAFVSGLLFALGLGLSGMTNANTVLSFLDISETWNPTLAFVMLGAIGVNVFAFRAILRRSRPLFDTRFYIPQRTDIDRSLVSGAALFGLGWGLSGYCPGTALTSLSTLDDTAIIFVVSMALGMFLHGQPTERTRIPSEPQPIQH